MDDALLSATKFYSVRPSSQIFLTVEVGDSQVGGTALQLNGSPIPFNPAGETPIGAPGQDLRRSVLQVVTTVKDVNPLTNSTSVTHHFRGGMADETFPYQVSVKTDNGRAQYFITYILS
jgi:hypothetical protein